MVRRDDAGDEAEEVDGNGCAWAAPLEEPEPTAELPFWCALCSIDRIRSKLAFDFGFLGFGSCDFELVASTDGGFLVVSAVSVDGGVDEVEGIGLSVGLVGDFFFLGWDIRISARVDIISIFFLNASDLLSSVAGDRRSLRSSGRRLLDWSLHLSGALVVDIWFRRDFRFLGCGLRCLSVAGGRFLHS